MNILNKKLKHEFISRIHAIETALSFIKISPSGAKQARMLRYLDFLVSDTARTIENFIEHLSIEIKNSNEPKSTVDIYTLIREISESTGKIVELNFKNTIEAKIQEKNFSTLIKLILLNSENGNAYTDPIFIKSTTKDDHIEIEILFRSIAKTTILPLQETSLKSTFDQILRMVCKTTADTAVAC